MHRTTLALLLLASTLRAQGNPPAVDQKDVNAAIAKGAEYLKRRGSDFGYANAQSELVVLTLLHAGLSRSDDPLDKGIAWVKGIDVEHLDGMEKHKTYRVAIAAMALEALHQDGNDGKAAQFAQFLVCNQCDNGEWAYGENIDLPQELKTPKEVVSGGGDPNAKPPDPGKKGGTTAKAKIPINCPHRKGGPKGDNSNTQFAILGLRACADLGSGIPDLTWKDAQKAMQDAQDDDGSWEYKGKSEKGGKSTKKGGAGRAPEGYGSMTASGFCDFVICDHFLGQDWKKDKGVDRGAKWLGDHFTVTENAKENPAQEGFGASFHYYYLYALERAGDLSGTEKFGGHAWYLEGARYLLDHQNPDGSWKDDTEEKGGKVVDTCFAILFLSRATPTISTK